jgi:opine dehydrogenase
MRVAVLGAGGVGLGTAALLASNGHESSVWARSPKGIGPMLDGKSLIARGQIAGEYGLAASLDMSEAVKDAELVVVAVPANGLRVTLDILAPLLRGGQAVAISAHLSLAALYLSRILSSLGADVAIAALASTPVTGRRLSPGVVEVATVRRGMTSATLRCTTGNNVEDVLFRALNMALEPAAGLLAVTLNNVNPTSHAATALCNLTRMEYSELWGSYRGISPAVARLIERLDDERIALAARFGVVARTLPEHWNASFGLPLDTIAAMAAEQDRRRGGGPAGPQSLDHRYVTEDIPYGIVPNIVLGEIAGIDMPAHRSCLQLFDILCARDFAAENDLLPELAIKGISTVELDDLCRSSHPKA